MRAGWNEGQHESWAYTEVDQTLSFGGDSAETGGGGSGTNGVWRSSQTVYRAVIGNTWR
jgi:hypothetical protein